MKKRFFIRCHRLYKDGIGTIHVHSRAWSRNICELIYDPYSDGSVFHEIPLDSYDEVIRSESFVQIMSILRPPKAAT